MDDAIQRRYHEYLRSRSSMGYLYRKLVLYPKIQKYVAGKCLDFGCGIGDFLRFNRTAIGCDINPYNVQYCTSMGYNCALITNGKTQFDAEFFETILIDNVIEHVSSHGDVMNEAYRLCAPKGNIIIGVPGLRGYSSDDDHKVFYDEESLIAMANVYNLMVKGFFYAPLFKSELLSRSLSVYAVYGVFQK